MNTDELRSNFKGRIHFNCKNGDEAFTDEYTMWLESQLLSENHEDLHDVSVLFSEFVTWARQADLWDGHEMDLLLNDLKEFNEDNKR